MVLAMVTPFALVEIVCGALFGAIVYHTFAESVERAAREIARLHASGALRLTRRTPLDVLLYLARRCRTTARVCGDVLRHETTRALARIGRGDDALAIVYDWLDATLFALIYAYMKHPLHIVALVTIWCVLLLAGGNVALELVLGNYTNGVSATAGAIILMRQTAHHAHVKRTLSEMSAKLDAHGATLAQTSQHVARLTAHAEQQRERQERESA